MSKAVSSWSTARLVPTTGRLTSILAKPSRTEHSFSRHFSTPTSWKTSSQCRQRKNPAEIRAPNFSSFKFSSLTRGQASILCRATAFRHDVSATLPSTWRLPKRKYATQPPQSSGRAAAKAKSREKADMESRRADSAASIEGEKAGSPDVPPLGHESFAHSMSKYLNLPHLPPRPTKEELLAAATGFWQRLKVRFKWASIRDMRPWNIDEWGAFVSWFMLGHLVWILVGTTTFFSIVILSINTVFAQGMLPPAARRIITH